VNIDKPLFLLNNEIQINISSMKLFNKRPDTINRRKDLHRVIHRIAGTILA
jgi:hypothetical protein